MEKIKSCLPLYKAEFTTPPTIATPKPNCPILFNICAILLKGNEKRD